MAISFKGAHFPPEVILMGVRWYLAYPLSTRHVEKLMEERGIKLDPHSFIGWGKSTQLGDSPGLAMGAKMAAPQKQVINIMGDMAFGTVGLDVETAVRCEIPILTIVLNNSYMSIYDNSRFPVALEKYQVKSLSGQFSDPEKIVPAIERGLASVDAGRPTVLEFITRDEGTFSKFAFV